MRTWKLGGLIVLTLLVLAAAGCGGDSSSEGVAAIETNGGDGSRGTSTGGGDAAASSEEARLEWAQCMREQGVDVGDPDANGMFQITPETGGDPDGAAFAKAREACGELPGLDNLEPPSPAEARKMQESLLAFARCMRSQGIEMPDPSFTGGAASVPLPDPEELEKPAFQAAQQACGKHLQLPGVGGESP